MTIQEKIAMQVTGRIVGEVMAPLISEIARLKAQRDALAAAVHATWDALESIYGGGPNDPIPYDRLPKDRQQLLDIALERVGAALAQLEEQ